MSTPVEKAINALSSCEAELRALVGSAAQSGDYDATVWITEHAKRLSDWLDEARRLSAVDLPGQLVVESPTQSEPERDRSIEIGVVAGFLGCELESQMVQEATKGNTEIDSLVQLEIAARPLRARDVGHLLEALSHLLQKQRTMSGMSENQRAEATLLIKNWAERFSHLSESEKDRPVKYETAIHLTSDLQIVFRGVLNVQQDVAAFARTTGKHPPVRQSTTLGWTQSPETGDDFQTRSAGGRQPRRRRKPGYPKFYRRNGDLVKVGWSKKHKREYSHKAPQHVVAVVTRAVADAGAAGAVFDTDRLIPVHDPEDGDDVPTYQAYLTLRWLRELGLVRRHGRRGYSVTDPDGLRAALDDRWSNLPELTRQ